MLVKKGNIIKALAVILWLPVMLFLISIIYNQINTDIGYSPLQPVKFSHKVHSGDYKIKCLFCHHSAEKNSFSALPTTESCMICHVALKSESELMKNVIKSYDEKKPIEWIRINKLPDFVRFNHASHVNASIDCESCHGKIDLMDTVFKKRDFTMKWCLDCHRNPKEYIILPKQITGIFHFIPNGYALTNEIIERNSKQFTSPAYGEYYTGNRKGESGIFFSKLPGKGPENCSSCHY